MMIDGNISEPHHSQYVNSQVTQEKTLKDIIGKAHRNRMESELSEPPIFSQEQVLFQQHQQSMQRFKQEQVEMQYIERFYAKQPISLTGQNDISNSVWIDTNQYNRKKKPDLLLKDLDEKTRNGKIEQGKSPFNVDEFIRMDGSKVAAQIKPAKTTKK